MAHVEWSAGIDSVSGALSKPSKSGQHSCAKMLLGTHRVAATTSNKCNRIYLRKKTERSTSPGANELFARVRFTAVAQAVNTRSKDLSKITYSAWGSLWVEFLQCNADDYHEKRVLAKSRHKRGHPDKGHRDVRCE